MRLKDQVAIVTGGARGIGKAIAVLFVKEEAKVAIVSRTAREVSETTRLLKDMGGEVIGIVGDVAKRQDVQKVIEETLATFKVIDILINCAAVQKPIGRFLDVDMDEWIRNIDINLIGTVTACRAVLPIMIKNKKGKIINFSGGGATSSRPNFSAYACSKSAVVRFTEILAEELREYNIQVNAVAPGAVNSRMLDEVLEAGEVAGTEFEEAQARAVRGGVPVDLAAQLVLYLASEESDRLAGRLISAVWDNWKDFDDTTITQIMESDRYTLRRIT